MAIKATLHIPDQSQGRDEEGDVMFALCGQRVLWGASFKKGTHGFGLLKRQITCERCVTKAESLTTITDEIAEKIGSWLKQWRAE